MNSRKLQVAVAFHRFGPYHDARLRAAASQCDLTAIELSAETADYAWERISDGDYHRITLFHGTDSRAVATKELKRRMDQALNKCRPDVVAVPGWSDKGALAALSWCVSNLVPAVLMSESTAHDESRTGWKESVKRQLIRSYASALVGGKRHIDYLLKLGMRSDQIFTGYDVVDNDYFAIKAEAIRDRESQIREQYRLPKNYFLASARFIQKKNLPTLIRAFAAYREFAVRERAWDLVLLGDGPLKPYLLALIHELGLTRAVLLPGFRQYDELPIYYALANAFVHPSTSEPWGLVINEAIASNLPVIVSSRCGCVPDLVQHGVNGFTFDPLHTQELTSLLLSVSSMSAEERKRLSESSRQIASKFGAEQFGIGLVEAAACALSSKRKSSTILGRLLLHALLLR